MYNRYYDTQEFKDNLSRYEKYAASGQAFYMDATDFIDIADYYMTHDQVSTAELCNDTALQVHPGDEGLLLQRSGLFILHHKFAEARAIVETLDQSRNDVKYQKAQLAYGLDKDVTRAEEMFREWVEQERIEAESQRNAPYDEDEEDEYGDASDRESEGTVPDEIIRDAYIHVISSFIELAEPARNYDAELVKRWIEDYMVTFSPIGVCDTDEILAEIMHDESLMDMITMYYPKLLENNPYFKKGWTILAIAQNVQGMIDESVDSAEYALAIDDQDPEALTLMAVSYAAMGTHDAYMKSIEYYQRYIDVTGEVTQNLNFATVLITLERYEEAAEVLNTAFETYSSLEDFPDEVLWDIFLISETFAQIDDTDRAAEVAQFGLSVRPNESFFHIALGTSYIASGQKDKALSAYLDALRNCPKAEYAKVSITIGVRLLTYDSPNYALNYFQAVADEITARGSEEYCLTKAYMALCYKALDNRDEYLECMREACEGDPETLSMVVGQMFPPEVNPKDYYEYLLNHDDRNG